MSSRALLTAGSLLVATGCGGPQSMLGELSTDASHEANLTNDATITDGASLEEAGLDAQGPDLDADDALLGYWPLLDSACSPPPAEGGPSPGPDDAGTTTITTLTDGGSIWGLALDDAAVYWIDGVNGSVLTAPLAGGPLRVVADEGTPDPEDIAVDDTYVYWVSRRGQRILRCPKAASSCTPFVVLAPFPVLRIALDAMNVYTLEGDRVLACPKTGCRDAPTVIASGLGTPYDIAVRDGTIYLLAYPPVSSSWPGPMVQILKCPVTGCGNAPTALASDPDPVGMAVDGRYVYWTSQVQADQPATIRRCAVCGCGGNPDVLLPTSADVIASGVVTDGTRIFFTDGSSPSTERLLACPVDGCVGAPTVLLDGAYSAWAVGSGRVILTTQSQILSLPE